ncbi:F420H2 dehydrogenase subunit O [Candidatus Methanoperedens nitroreducens]|uniref:F420H2 dehydrogenase subunit O n=1 Tax=Candidatus Methanoperedens nitratireducens TaxID=1392998 RepID=A0A062V7K6_9EURY|nr:F420H2 dehydrogenase subunit FpoO [Candidatus Methanoperedens nitroreducens]KCZ72533.1 F420H2 dehydrogenase subunit O [Candidatus Methanoperedens nitroreducens]MDJ1423533.1 F420H2 dehydrogenase subunit FpoO [Candidatus Methanoperedens sp.]
MADCNLCGVSRPTLCPVKVNDPSVSSAYPTGTWRGINEECLHSCHEANLNRVPIRAKKCDLCGIKNAPLFQVKVSVPIFQEPYHRAISKAICESCLGACEESIQRREAEKKEAHH